VIALILLCSQAVDAFGDPLPDGAVARLGTIRWRHGGYVLSVAFSPDGRHALSASESVALWDIKTGLRVRSFEGTAPVAFVDEGCAIAAMPSGTLALWEITTGRRLREFEGAKGWVGSIAVDRRGRFLLAGGQDQTVRLWNIKTGACLRTQLEKSPISSVALTPDGRFAATSTWKEPAVLWEVETGKQIQVFEGRADQARSMVFTPDSQRVLVGYNSGAIEVREVPSGKLAYSLPPGPGRIEGAAISADGKLALSASSNSTLKLWEVETGKEVRTFSGHRSSVYSVSFSPDGRLAVSGAGDGTVGLWDVATGRRLNVYDTHESEVLSCAFTLDGHRALTASHDQTISMWDWATGKRLRTYGSTDGTAWSLALAPDGKAFFVANGTSALKWDIESGQAAKFKVDGGGVYSIAVSRDGRSFLCGGNSLHLWDGIAGRERRSFPKSNGVKVVVFCLDGRHLLAGQGSLVSKWNLETVELACSFEGQQRDVESLAVSPDGCLALSGSSDGTAALWDLNSSQLKRRIPGHESGIRSVAFSPDGSTFATGSYDKTLALWDVESGKRLASFRGHIGPVHSVAFSPSGAELLSTSGDTSALVWRPSMKYRERARKVGVKEALAEIDSPDFERWCEVREALRRFGETAIEPLLEAYPPESADPPSDKTMREFEERLENDAPEIRGKAREELKGLGRRALPWIRRRLGADGSSELRAALQEARDSIERQPFRAVDRGRLRAVLVLIDMPCITASREALKKYAAGPADSYAAESARRTLVPE
jgi:WD40 repeat protein